MTDLNSLMIFAKVVEAKSFSEAARLLKMPPSTVSRRVADLEDELGGTLARTLNPQPPTHGRRVRSSRTRSSHRRTQRSSRQHRFKPPFERLGRTAAFCAAQHLRLVTRAADRCIPGIVPEGPGAGLHYGPNCRSNCRGCRPGVQSRRTALKIRRSSRAES